MDLVLIYGCVFGTGLMLVCIMLYASINSGIQRNETFGIRTRATKSSDAAWKAGHEAAKPWLLVAIAVAAIMLATTGVAYVITRPELAPAALVAGPGALLVLGLLLGSGFAANRAAERAQARA